jgi:hypothetical protein
MRPLARVPVIQLSIDGRLPASAHLELGRSLAPLRDEGVFAVVGLFVVAAGRPDVAHAHVFDHDAQRALAEAWRRDRAGRPSLSSLSSLSPLSPLSPGRRIASTHIGRHARRAVDES